MKGTGRTQRFTTSLPGVARACPDLPEFARGLETGWEGSKSISNERLRRFRVVLVDFIGFSDHLWTEKVSANQIAGFLRVRYLENGSTVRDDFLHGDKGP